MRLTKHHGLGNDFLVLLDLQPDLARPLDAGVVRALCDRHRGVGADGFIRVGPPVAGADVTMELRNADGGRAEMSGNGIRCLGHAVARARGRDTLALTVATDAGLRRVRVRPGVDRDTAAVEVDMGPARPGPDLPALPGPDLPALPGPDLPALPGPDLPALPGPDLPALPAPIEAIKAVTVDMGNPHLVLLVEDPATVELVDLGVACQRVFDQGINVEVVSVAPDRPDSLHLRVWERGVGLTRACGTGACAAASAAHDWGVVGDRVRVRMPGGEVDVALGATVTLTGPAVYVADIEVAV